MDNYTVIFILNKHDYDFARNFKELSKTFKNIYYNYSTTSYAGKYNYSKFKILKNCIIYEHDLDKLTNYKNLKSLKIIQSCDSGICLNSFINNIKKLNKLKINSFQDNLELDSNIYTLISKKSVITYNFKKNNFYKLKVKMNSSIKLNFLYLFELNDDYSSNLCQYNIKHMLLNTLNLNYYNKLLFDHYNITKLYKIYNLPQIYNHIKRYIKNMNLHTVCETIDYSWLEIKHMDLYCYSIYNINRIIEDKNAYNYTIKNNNKCNYIHVDIFRKNKYIKTIKLYKSEIILAFRNNEKIDIYNI